MQPRFYFLTVLLCFLGIRPAAVFGATEPEPSPVAQTDAWFLSGQVLHAEPDAEAPVTARLDGASVLPVLARQGEWMRVRYLGEEGWIDGNWVPPWNRKDAYRGVQRNLIEKAVSSDYKRLKIAKKILGVRDPVRKTKGLDIYSDVDDPLLLDRMVKTSELASEIYFAQFGRLPSGKPKETVVLFAHRDDYDAYLEKMGSEKFIGSGGHAGSGLASMWKEERNHGEILGTLLHEIGHLYNSRSLARRLPQWLEEGMAVRLGLVWIEGEETRANRAGFRPIDGKIAQLWFRMKQGEMPGIGALASLDQDTFQEHWATAYPHAGVFIYFLQQDPGYRLGFASFLEEVANGYRATFGLLLKHLDTDVETLDQEFRGWIRFQNQRLEDRYKR